MANAAITYVYNEKYNLPIWINYYGNLFGRQNLFVVDRYSDDGSTDRLDGINLIKVPRTDFDEDEKTNFMSHFHASMTSFFDAVVITDADEILVPDPDIYSDLNDYISKMPSDYANGIGLDLMHIINREFPLDFDKPILSQRVYGKVFAPESKLLLSRVPIRWLPGLHASDKKPLFDKGLFIFHLKHMDYVSATNRQKVNLSSVWSAASLERNYGAHHRFSLTEFMQNSFLSSADLVNRGQLEHFVMDEFVRKMEEGTVRDPEGFYRPPMDISFLTKIPDRFKNIF